MPPINHNILSSSPCPPYTPEQIQHVLHNALSSPMPMTDSPLSHKRAKTAESGYHSNSASFSSSPPSPPMFLPVAPNVDHETPRFQDGPDTDFHPSPIRPSPAPRLRAKGTPTTYEVEGSFLHAMIGLLERQAKIVPDYMLTKADVKRIVQSELRKDAEVDSEPKSKRGYMNALEKWMTPFAFALAFAGLAAYRRACAKHPREVAEYVRSAWKGGAVGLASGLVVKAVLRGLGIARSGSRDF